MYRLLAFISAAAFINYSAAQDPCVVFVGESAEVAQMLTGDSEGHYRFRTVVHIIHSDSFPNSNLDDAIVLDAIEALNEDISEAGMSTWLMAIEHHDLDDHFMGSVLNSGGACFPIPYASGGNAIMSAFAAEYAWDTQQYLNIYCIPFMCYPTYGFAWVYPQSTNLADGLWINVNAFGRFGDHLDDARDLNRTMTHEFGHYAGLFHVFQGVDYCGELVENCQLQQDYVCDTAPTKLNWSCENPTCPPAWNSLRPWAAYQHNNHMDYYVDSCRTAFTAGQVERMREFSLYLRGGVIDVLTCNNDVTGDKLVGVEDLMCVLGCYELDCCDITGDGYTGTNDILAILMEYGNDCNYKTEN